VQERSNESLLHKLFPIDFSISSIRSAAVFLLIFIVLLFFLSYIAAVFYVLGIVHNEVAVGNAATEFTFLLSILLYMFAYKGMSAKDVVSALGIGRSRLTKMAFVIGIALFLVLFSFSIIISLIGYVTNTTVSTNTQLVLANEPLWFYVFTFTLVPVFEELLFRAFLVPRLGILLSAVIFALGHASYNSTFGIEIMGALLFGLLAGWIFRKTKSLYPSMIAHMLVNALAVAAYII
jgi:membrane protease YdiL (CAAX protease family)